jgi:CRP-like cAMP-binding protein
MSLVDDLQALPLFSTVPRGQLEALALYGEEIDVPAGTKLTHEGKYEGSVFIVISGSVQIDRGGQAVNLIPAGDFFGEIEAIDGGPRMATSRALVDSRLVVVGHRQFNDLLDQVPAIRDRVMSEMDRRLARVEREE